MKSLYHGWLVVFAAMLVFMIAVGITTSSFGLFVVPVSTEFGMSRADTNMVVVFMMIGGGVMSPFVGRLLDVFPIKIVIIVAALLLGGALVGLGLSHSLALSGFLIVVPMMAGTLGTSGLAMNVLVARWFIARRARALALAQIGMSLGGVVIAPLVGYLVVTQGWRQALILCGLGLGTFLIVLFLVLRVVPRPEELAAAEGAPMLTPAAAQTAPDKPVTMRTILTTPSFWTIGVGSTLGIAVSQVLSVSITPLALDEGYGAVRATTLLAIFGIGALAGVVFVAVVADRIERTILLGGAMLVLAGIFLLPLVVLSYPILIVMALAGGLSAMIAAPLCYTLLADMFGAGAFGSVQGLVGPVMTTIIAVSVRLSGEVYDRTGSYDLIFPASSAFLVIGAVLVLSTRLFARRAALDPASAEG